MALWASTAPRSTNLHPEGNFRAAGADLAVEPPLMSLLCVSLLCPEQGRGAVALLHAGTLGQVAPGALPRALPALRPCSFSRHLFGSLVSVMYYLHILRTPCKCLLETGIWIVKGAISIAHSELLENFTLCFSCNSLSKNKKDKTNWHCLKVKGIPGQMLQLWAVAVGRETHRCCRACGRAAPHLP